MSICHGCNQPLEPLAQIRTYHTQCDPQGRVEMLERALQSIAGGLSAQFMQAWEGKELEAAVVVLQTEAHDALAYKPAKWTQEDIDEANRRAAEMHAKIKWD